MVKKVDPSGYLRKVFYSSEDGGWVAVASGIPGCSAFGNSAVQALKELEVAIRGHLTLRKNRGLPIPGKRGKS